MASTYTTIARVRGYYQQISTDDVSDTALQAIIDQRVDAWIHAKLRRRYTVPFSPVPDEIKLLADIIGANWLVWQAFNRTSHWSVVEGFWKSGWDLANTMVKELIDGTMTLAVAQNDTGYVQTNIPADQVTIESSTDEELWVDHMVSTRETDAVDTDG